MKKICILGHLYSSNGSPTCQVLVNSNTVYDGPAHSSPDCAYLFVPGELVPIAKFDLSNDVTGTVDLEIRIQGATLEFALLGEIRSGPRLDEMGDPVLDSNGDPVLDQAIFELEYPDEQAHLQAVNNPMADDIPVPPWYVTKNGINDGRGRSFEFESVFSCRYNLVGLSVDQ